jgi:hypothetical protein
VKTLEAILASPPERDGLVVQLFVRDGAQWGEVFLEDRQFKIDLYPNSRGNNEWRLDLNEVLHVLQLAKDELIKRQ